MIDLGRAAEVLSAGGAVVVPNPAPMTYGIVATDARKVNEVKHRPIGQNVAVSLHAREQWQQVVPAVDLPTGVLRTVVELLEQRLSILLPLGAREALPDWVTPAVRDGHLAAFNGYWAPTAALWDRFPRLYGSSANLTGRPPAADAGQAAAMFGTGCPVVAVADPDEASGPRAASTMVRIDPAGRLELVRAGAQDLGSGLTAGLPLAAPTTRVRRFLCWI
jgi:tRNA A37 threonylcarbamoyladenosine synthetase subunit TsaC/SUA5/YrdC